MAGSSKGLELKLGLLGGSIDATALETELGTDETKGSFVTMINSSISMKALADSNAAITAITGSLTATQELVKNQNAMRVVASKNLATEKLTTQTQAAKEFMQSSVALREYYKSFDNYTRLKNFIAGPSSVIKKEIFTTSGSYTVIASGTGSLALLGIFCLAGGGAGGVGDGSGGAGGGSGGEAKWEIINTGLPTTNQTVTVGGATTASSVGALVTATAGNDGANASGGPGAGGATAGTTTDGAHEKIVDFDPLTAVWVAGETLSIAGGAGGDGDGAGGNGTDGSDGWSGSGGSGGIVATAGAEAGSPLGGGAGGGADDVSGAADPAAANSGAGGGGGAGSGGTPGGGAGGSGLVVIFSVVNE